MRRRLSSTVPALFGRRLIALLILIFIPFFSAAIPFLLLFLCAVCGAVGHFVSAVQCLRRLLLHILFRSGLFVVGTVPIVLPLLLRLLWRRLLWRLLWRLLLLLGLRYLLWLGLLVRIEMLSVVFMAVVITTTTTNTASSVSVGIAPSSSSVAILVVLWMVTVLLLLSKLLLLRVTILLLLMAIDLLLLRRLLLIKLLLRRGLLLELLLTIGIVLWLLWSVGIVLWLWLALLLRIGVGCCSLLIPPILSLRCAPIRSIGVVT